jgi:hypothetical protein
MLSENTRFYVPSQEQGLQRRGILNIQRFEVRGDISFC